VLLSVTSMAFLSDTWFDSLVSTPSSW
jgi:hypothetical protein